VDWAFLMRPALSVVPKAKAVSTIETERNKPGWWRARLSAEANEKPLAGWTGYVYASEEEAKQRIRDYGDQFGVPYDEQVS
jgi:hypothetical protein